MKHYIEIHLNYKQPIMTTWAEVYTQLHIGIVESNNNIAVSFPKYNGKSLGNIIRLFGDHDILMNFDVASRLSDLFEVVSWSEILEVPEEHGYVIFARVQKKMNPTGLIKRRARRHNLTFQEAAMQYSGYRCRDTNNYPFIELYSYSSRKSFKLNVKKKVAESAVNNGFSTYGLSSVSTVPDF